MSLRPIVNEVPPVPPAQIAPKTVPHPPAPPIDMLIDLGALGEGVFKNAAS